MRDLLRVVLGSFLALLTVLIGVPLIVVGLLRAKRRRG